MILDLAANCRTVHSQSVIAKTRTTNLYISISCIPQLSRTIIVLNQTKVNNIVTNSYQAIKTCFFSQV